MVIIRMCCVNKHGVEIWLFLKSSVKIRSERGWERVRVRGEIELGWFKVVWRVVEHVFKMVCVGVCVVVGVVEEGVVVVMVVAGDRGCDEGGREGE